MAHMVTDQNHVSALRFVWNARVWNGIRGTCSRPLDRGVDREFRFPLFPTNPIERLHFMRANTHRYIYIYMYSKIRPNGPLHEQGAIVFIRRCRR